MAVLPIYLADEPILRQKSKRVRIIDHSLQKLMDDMLETMQEAHGVGLAAPQVGVAVRVIVIQIPEHEASQGWEEPFALVNPKVVRRTGEREVEEGCLSIPGYRGLVKRSERVTIKGLNRDGVEVRIRATELLGQALEHEIDHLDGILYIDRLVSPDQLWKIEPKPAPEEDELEEVGVGEAGL